MDIGSKTILKSPELRTIGLGRFPCTDCFPDNPCRLSLVESAEAADSLSRTIGSPAEDVTLHLKDD